MGAKVIGKCKLCDKEKELQNSHYVPKFIYDWLKKEGTGAFRNPEKGINRIFQDGNKDYLLCYECEQKFSKREKRFSENIFKPVVNDEITSFKIDDSFIYLMVSIFWRLTLTNAFGGAPENDKLKVDQLAQNWKEFLLSEGPKFLNTTGIEFHLYAGVGKTNGSNDFVRYLARVPDGGLLESDELGLLFFKLPRFFFFCLYRGTLEGEFFNMEIFNNSIFQMTNCKMQGDIVAYFMKRTEELYLEKLNMSETQKQKTLERTRRMELRFKDKDLGKLNEYLKNRN